MLKKLLSVILCTVTIMLCFAGCGKNLSPVTQDVGKVTLSKGVNLSALEDKDKYKPNSYLNKKSTYTEIVKKGFDHIRLPVDFRNFTDDKGILDEKSFMRIDNIIKA